MVHDKESIVRSHVVVVRQDGKGNFATFNDFIAVAPNNIVARDGYTL